MLFLFVLLSLLAVLFVSPIIIVFINSFKTKFNIISQSRFRFRTAKPLQAPIIMQTVSIIQVFFLRFSALFFITVFAVVVLVICTSMAAWYITRGKIQVYKACVLSFVFSMIVPFPDGNVFNDFYGYLS